MQHVYCIYKTYASLPSCSIFTCVCLMSKDGNLSEDPGLELNLEGWWCESKSSIKEWNSIHSNNRRYVFARTLEFCTSDLSKLCPGFSNSHRQRWGLFSGSDGLSVFTHIFNGAFSPKAGKITFPKIFHKEAQESERSCGKKLNASIPDLNGHHEAIPRTIHFARRKVQMKADSDGVRFFSP